MRGAAVQAGEWVHLPGAAGMLVVVERKDADPHVLTRAEDWQRSRVHNVINALVGTG